MEVFADEEKFECSISLNSDHQVFTINEVKYEIKEAQLYNSLLKITINQQIESFFCQDTETHTLVISGGFTYVLRSNLLRKQVLTLRKIEYARKVFQNLICADLFGRVLKLNVVEGDLVETGQIMLTLESMKTEIHVLCPTDARVKKIHVKEGIAVVEKQILLELEEN